MEEDLVRFLEEGHRFECSLGDPAKNCTCGHSRAAEQLRLMQDEIKRLRAEALTCTSGLPELRGDRSIRDLEHILMPLYRSYTIRATHNPSGSIFRYDLTKNDWVREP